MLAKRDELATCAHAQALGDALCDLDGVTNNQKLKIWSGGDELWTAYR